MVKTVIHVLTHNVCNLTTTYSENFWGLGDIIRGTVKLYYLSKLMGFKLIVDLQLHPISQFLLVQTHEYSELIKQNEKNIEFVFPGKVEKHIASSQHDVMFFLTNDLFEGEIDADCKEFIKLLFCPNAEFQQYIDEKMQTIPYPIFNILHVRSGDNEMNNIKINPMVFTLVDFIGQYVDTNDVLISDSYFFKKVLEKKYPVFSFNSRPVHMGKSIDSKSIDSKSIDSKSIDSKSIDSKSIDTCLRDTLFEYILLSKAHHIKTFSVYNWVSGFVYWASQIYDIPLINLKTIR